MAENCVTLIQDLKSGDALDLFEAMGTSTDSMSAADKEEARNSVNDMLHVPEVILRRSALFFKPRLLGLETDGVHVRRHSVGK
jgi:hypothetical protein